MPHCVRKFGNPLEGFPCPNHDNKRMRDLSPLKELLPAVLERLANESGSAAGLLPFWSEAVGEAIARHSKPVRLEKGTLTIETKNAEWKRELENREPVLISRLGTHLGTGKILRIEFSVEE